jgi:hypothetical protein
MVNFKLLRPYLVEFEASNPGAVCDMQLDLGGRFQGLAFFTGRQHHVLRFSIHLSFLVPVTSKASTIIKKIQPSHIAHQVITPTTQMCFYQRHIRGLQQTAKFDLKRSISVRLVG